MRPLRIEGATMELGAPADWKHPVACAPLAIRLVVIDGMMCCQSAWEMTPAEIETLMQGGRVVLTVAGAHPPVALDVERPRCLAAALDGAL